MSLLKGKCVPLYICMAMIVTKQAVGPSITCVCPVDV